MGITKEEGKRYDEAYDRARDVAENYAYGMAEAFVNAVWERLGLGQPPKHPGLADDVAEEMVNTLAEHAADALFEKSKR
jgi:hypothetical protein